MSDAPPLSRSVAGRVAIVTGAASGMGRATALLLASEGAKVAVTDLDLATCEAVAAEAGTNAKAFALDVAILATPSNAWSPGSRGISAASTSSSTTPACRAFARSTPGMNMKRSGTAPSR